MACVTKGLADVMVGVRFTGRERGVTVSMKYCGHPNCIETDTGFVGLDNFIQLSA